MLGIGVLLLTGVLAWEDVITERGAWDVFIWYGGLVRMAEALGETGITKRFAEVAAGLSRSGWHWAAAFAVLLLVYFYAHYGFASHHRARFGDVHSVPRRNYCRGRARRVDGAAARLRFKSECVAHPLRHHTRTDLVRRRLCKAAHVVVDWLRSFSGQPAHLDDPRIALVEGAALVVV